MTRRARTLATALTPRASACALGCAALVSSGCAQNALLELYIEVPPPVTIGASTETATHVRLSVLADEADPTAGISGSDSRVYALRPGLARPVPA